MLLILREEFICLSVLLFLAFYYYVGKVKLNGEFFGSVIIYTILFVIFDMITVITVNTPSIPAYVNDFVHYIFYFLGILAGFSFYMYSIQVCKLYAIQKTLKQIGYIPIAFFVVIALFQPIQYANGFYTNYSTGMLALSVYMIFLGYCAISFILLVIFNQQVEDRVKHTLFPLVLLLSLLTVLQIFVPELLMNAGLATLLALGVFISIDNPDVKYKEQALWDFLTGLKNRNSYNQDLIKYEHLNKPIGVLVADLNNLKLINDNYGHEEGDLFISAAANILKECLISASDVYRVGGDEFVAIFVNPNDTRIESEINNIAAKCLSVTSFPCLLEIAIGYQSNNQNVHDLIKMADKKMYEHKRILKS